MSIEPGQLLPALLLMNMLDLPNTPAPITKLRPKVVALRARAREMGRPVLLRTHLRLPAIDPWQLLQSPNISLDTFYAWHDGRAHCTFAALGALSARDFHGEQRFRDAQTYCAELLEQVADVSWHADLTVEADLPLALGGFAFAPGERSEGWQSWPDGAMYVPHVLVYRRGLECRAVLYQTLSADCDVDREMARLHQRIERLLGDLQPPSVQPTPIVLEPELQVQLGETREAFITRVEQARQAMAAGSFDKVVMARAARFETLGEFDVLKIAHALRDRHSTGVAFAIALEGRGCFVGATPELLLAVSGRDILTRALAGTAARGATPEEDHQLGATLLASAKDQYEHKVVTDMLRQELGAWCVEVQTSSEPHLLQLRQVQHLETPFVGRLRQAGGVLEMVEKLHPTPAVGGWPKSAALSWLRSHETLDRGWYAGPVGWVTAAGDGVFAVAIRSMWVGGKVAYGFAGAGIVASSNAEAEWRETELKLRTVAEALRVKE